MQPKPERMLKGIGLYCKNRVATTLFKQLEAIQIGDAKILPFGFEY